MPHQLLKSVLIKHTIFGWNRSVKEKKVKDSEIVQVAREGLKSEREENMWNIFNDLTFLYTEQNDMVQ